MSRVEAKAEATALLERLGLGPKMASLPSTLSGGQLRRLSVAGALMGGAPVLFFDEPTTGLDPKTRRQVWDLLLEMKISRTIILTTHSMEEAQILGDNIAVMSNGRVQAQGTLSELRIKHSPWYHFFLTVCGSGTSVPVRVLSIANQ